MRKTVLTGWVVFAALITGSALSQTAPENSADQGQPDKIMIVGQRPGPGLWKISKGDHVLWVFGSYSPLPKKLEWRSRQVETILSQSQEYLPPPVAMTDIGFFRSLTLLPYVIGLKKSPDGATLKDILPPDIYGRWLVLKGKYIGQDDDIEQDRPIFVADELYRKALDHAGLSSDKEVRDAIEKIVQKNKIKTTPSEIKLAVDSPTRLIKDFKKSQIEDAACFSTTLTRLENDIDAMRVRANAWSKGDLDGIEKLSFEDQENACRAAMQSSAAFTAQPGFQSVQPRMREAWIANAEQALAANSSTFGMLPIKEILDAKGTVMALQAKGYVVEKPE